MVFDNLITKNPSVVAIIFSSSLLIAALALEYVSNLTPCQMCIWQRWPHLGVVVICLLSMLIKNHYNTLLLLAGLLSLISSAIGLWHSGVELGYFNSPSSCIDTNFNADITLNDLLTKPISGCDVIVWDFLGLSMANWNTILSSFLGFFCITFGFYNRVGYYGKEKRT